jgi:hypothetical protein
MFPSVRNVHIRTACETYTDFVHLPLGGGNCFAQLPGSNASSIPEGVAMAFPSASAFEAYIQPGTGHGLNFQYNATAGYKVVQDFLASNGLGA